MDIYKYLNRVQQLHTLLKSKATGTPRELAKKLKLSERQTLEYVRELKDSGIPIAFCKHQKTYYYEKEVIFKFEFRILSPDELQNREGGRNLLSKTFPNLFLDCYKTAVNQYIFGLSVATTGGSRKDL